LRVHARVGPCRPVTCGSSAIGLHSHGICGRAFRPLRRHVATSPFGHNAALAVGGMAGEPRRTTNPRVRVEPQVQIAGPQLDFTDPHIADGEACWIPFDKTIAVGWE